MCSNSVLCPVCCQTNFSNIDALRNSLIKVANSPLTCPICKETLQGLDKLTIHLFSHTSLTIDNDKKPSIRAAATISPSFHKSKSVGMKSWEKCGDTTTGKELIETSTDNTNNEANEQIASIEFGAISNLSAVTPTYSDAYVNQKQDPSQSQHLNEPKCDICGSTFRSTELMNMHRKFIHGNAESMKQSSIPEAKISNLQNVWTKTLERDDGGAEGSEPSTDLSKYHQCNLCAKVFKMKGSLRVHLKVVHFLGLKSSNTKDITNRLNGTINKNPSNISSTTKFNVETETSQATIEHIQSLSDNHSSTVSPELSNKIPTESINTRSLESAKIWECDTCSKLFTTKYFLKKHKRLHTGEMPYSCEICSKTFTFQQSYHKHLLYHSDEKPHMCQTCGRAFKELSTLHNHERIHSGEKPFKCETCGKCFRQRVSYLVHKRIHTGVMPYKCTACEKSFRYKVSQRTHKCMAQPPGTVVRQTGDLLQRLLHSTAILPEITATENEAPLVNTLCETVMVPELNLKVLNEDQLTKSIDEIVAESCNKMGIGVNSHIMVDDIFQLTSTDINDNEIPSPSDKFQNMCLYSPSQDPFVNNLEAINDDSLKQLFYHVEENL